LIFSEKVGGIKILEDVFFAVASLGHQRISATRSLALLQAGSIRGLTVFGKEKVASAKKEFVSFVEWQRSEAIVIIVEWFWNLYVAYAEIAPGMHRVMRCDHPSGVARRGHVGQGISGSSGVRLGRHQLQLSLDLFLLPFQIGYLLSGCLDRRTDVVNAGRSDDRMGGPQ